MLILYIVNTENIIRIIGLDLLTLRSIQQQKKEAYSGCFFARYLLLLILLEGNVLNHVFTVMI